MTYKPIPTDTAGGQPRIQSWAGANLEVVTVADVVFTVTAAYYKKTSDLDFAAWDMLR